MEPPFASHDVYFHLRILIGVVLGLGLTRMLSGIVKIVQHPAHRRLHATHVLWVAIVLVSAVHFWWFEFSLIHIAPWHFSLFGFVLFYAFLFYLMASLLLPETMDEYPSYEDYFFSRRRWFFGLLAATVPIDLVDTLAKGHAHFESLGIEYPVRLGLMLVLCAIAAWTASRRFHLLFALFYLLYLLSWILRVYRALEI